MISTGGKAYEHKGGVVIQTHRPPVDNVSDDVVILWHDRRYISPEQRRKAWALIGEVSAACGYLSAADKEHINADLKREFLIKRMDTLTAEAIRRFSLSDVDMTTARLYIDFLVEFIVEHSIPTKEPIRDLCEDVQAYVYACCMHRRCAVCGKGAEIHHVDRVGMGRNRDEMVHIGMRALPLCRAHHQEAHQRGDEELMEKYHLEPIEITEQLAKKLGLGKGRAE